MSAPLPDSAALREVLAGLPSELSPSAIDRLWLFPPRQLGERESGLVVASLLPRGGEPADHRRVLTVQFVARPGKNGIDVTHEIDEQGRAPANRIERLIIGVLHRLEVAEDPHHRAIQGEESRWADLLRDMGVELDPVEQE